MCVCMCVCIPETLLHLKLTQYYKLTTLQLNIKQKIFLKRCKEKNFKYQKENPYGVEAMVLRSAVPAGVHVSPISIEELFVFMVKEAR